MIFRAKNDKNTIAKQALEQAGTSNVKANAPTRKLYGE